jgi:ribosome-associated heat shock protein Hsp15
MADGEPAAGRQRLDKWLWFAHVVRTRRRAQEIAVSGHVRLSGKRVASASQTVRPGDVLTIALEGRVRVLEVVGFALRRGDAATAAGLYRDLSPPPPGRGT